MAARDSWEILVEIYARILSYAVTDEESERVIQSVRKLGDKIRHYSNQNLRHLQETKVVERPFCKHSGTCTQNCIRSFVRSFIALYTANYALAIAPALLRGQVFKRPEILWKAAGKDTRSFALWLASFISSYKGLLCLFRRFFKLDNGIIAFVAGLLAGGTIFLDSNQSRRIAIALYLSTRNLHFIYRWIWRKFLEERWGIKREPVGERDGELVRLANAMAVHTDRVISSLAPMSARQIEIPLPASTSPARNTSRASSIESITTPPPPPPPKARQMGASPNILDISSNGSAKSNTLKNNNLDRPISSTSTTHPKFEVFEEDEPSSPATNLSTGSYRTPGTSIIWSDFKKTSTTLKSKKSFDLKSFLRDMNAVIFMSLSSGQILYAFTAMPHTLAKSYFNFLLSHGDLSPKHMDAIASAINGSTKAITTKWIPSCEGEGVAGTIEKFLPNGINPKPFTLLNDLLMPTVRDHDYIVCSLQHPDTPSCRQSAINFFTAEYYRASQLYAPLNIIMTIVFRPRAIIKSPIKTMLHLLFSTARSAFFLTCYCTLGWSSLCAMRRYFGKDAPWMYVVNGMMAGMTVLIDVKSRRLELAMYCLPRALESFYRCGVEWGWWTFIPKGEGLYFCLSTGILMLLYQHDPESIPETYRNLFTRFLGAN